MKCGLMYLSQEACLLGDISYHSYEGLVVEDSEKETLARDLGVHNKVMFLRNHGAICCGDTIEEALFYAYHLVLACETQLKMVSDAFYLKNRILPNLEFIVTGVLIDINDLLLYYLGPSGH